MSVRIAVVGGGSSMFVPGLIRRLLEIPCYEGAELRLMDVDSRRVSVMRDLGVQLAAAEDCKLEITAGTDRRAALRDADFVIVAISVGGMAAWETDIEVPARYGVFMHIADTIGPGGILRSLRNTPVVASVARDVAEVAPDAIVLNYTNPASANAMAMARTAARRCHCAHARRFRSSGLAGRSDGAARTRSPCHSRSAASTTARASCRFASRTVGTRSRWSGSGRPSRSCGGRSTRSA